MKPYLIFFLSWLFPGLGHLLQKKILKGVVFFCGILMLLILGIVMKGKFYTTEQIHPLMILGFLGDLGSGVFYFLIKLIGWGQGDIRSLTYQYGTTYMVSAGLINYLVALNAFDLAKGKKR